MSDFEQHRNPVDVMVICDAYESGYGHGFKNDGKHYSKLYFVNPEEAEAYDLGYNKGQVDALKPKAIQAPQGWRLVEEDYQRIFNAFTDATSLTSGDCINVSVSSFWKHLEENQPIPPKEINK